MSSLEILLPNISRFLTFSGAAISRENPADDLSARRREAEGGVH